MLTELSYRTVPGQAPQQLVNSTMLTELSYRNVPGQAPQQFNFMILTRLFYLSTPYRSFFTKIAIDRCHFDQNFAHIHVLGSEDRSYAH